MTCWHEVAGEGPTFQQAAEQGGVSGQSRAWVWGEEGPRIDQRQIRVSRIGLGLGVEVCVGVLYRRSGFTGGDRGWVGTHCKGGHMTA